jgi:hypothetical protein
MIWSARRVNGRAIARRRRVSPTSRDGDHEASPLAGGGDEALASRRRRSKLHPKRRLVALGGIDLVLSESRVCLI